MGSRIIAIFTGNRAEYGLQYPILRAVDRHPALDYRLLVSGAHLDPNFGRTLDEIRADGFRIDAEIKIDMDAASLLATAQAIGSGIIAISRVLAEMKPDFLVVRGPFEGLAAVIALESDEYSNCPRRGRRFDRRRSPDDSVRHAMTKLSHLHFTTNVRRPTAFSSSAKSRGGFIRLAFRPSI
jgi:UDP-N-acetylglucosamine 2-epimerase (non-hydrolysing)/GDP/UDP-N,N'-diacetylbacillosamine 2-epimerase (hydrolysing)